MAVRSPADDYREIADSCRSIPSEFGLREHSVSVVITTWSGERVGEGAPSRRYFPLRCSGQNPKVRWPDQKELALGGLADGSAKIGPVTPEFGNGLGIDRNLFAAIVEGETLKSYETLHYRIKGPQCPNGALYRQSNVNVDRAIQVTITAQPVSEEFECDPDAP